MPEDKGFSGPQERAQSSLGEFFNHCQPSSVITSKNNSMPASRLLEPRAPHTPHPTLPRYARSCYSAKVTSREQGQQVRARQGTRAQLVRATLSSVRRHSRLWESKRSPFRSSVISECWCSQGCLVCPSQLFWDRRKHLSTSQYLLDSDLRWTLSLCLIWCLRLDKDFHSSH